MHHFMLYGRIVKAFVDYRSWRPAYGRDTQIMDISYSPGDAID